LLSIVDRETLWGQAAAYTKKGEPDGTGDYGHGHGFFQVDDRAHPDFIASGDWKDVRKAADYIIKAVLESSYLYLSRKFPGRGPAKWTWDAVSAYNCGAGNVRRAIRRSKGRDAYTTGKDYAADVQRRYYDFWLGWYLEKIKERTNGSSDGNS
jgi:hypothetical protein